jgi:hypothetical protein
MNEISLALLNKWRCSISHSGSGKEDFFKHDRVSMLLEARASVQGAVMKIMLRRSCSIICGKAPNRERRNITSTAT